MTLLAAVLLGLVQGITEFLPISSSGHLTILECIFKLNFNEGSNLFFNVTLHLGTLIAIVIYYRSELKIMLGELFSIAVGNAMDGRDEYGRRLPKLRLTILILVGTVPLMLILPIKKYVEQIFGKLWVTSVMLLVTGAILFLSDRIKQGKKRERGATLGDALLIGVAQAVSVLPGLSRSGTTIAMGLTRGFKRSFAVKFSFLLSIPAVLCSFIIELIDAIGAGIDWSLFPVYLAGMVASAVSGFLSIGLVNLLVRKTKLNKLARYVWCLGVVSLIISLFI